MSRTILSLLLLLPGTALAANAPAVPDGSDCPEARSTGVASEGSASGSAEASTGMREARATPVLQGGGGEVTEQLPAPSWRSFLPGMLR
ncbi:hypothetical protein LY625_05170 [Lysobacter sp. GX 14042]|uniref:hypothetical protein n=1 Tax=Lysobacter sp. GX 14042 TaxID=2907155 RepID=UPI001F25F9CE|nr:hypothetical protein [Lysobacter sp. GX 14042]MCE7032012.1 hypothetical protein [Lysobacter sp. GX 14042]